MKKCVPTLAWQGSDCDSKNLNTYENWKANIWNHPTIREFQASLHGQSYQPAPPLNRPRVKPRIFFSKANSFERIKIHQASLQAFLALLSTLNSDEFRSQRPYHECFGEGLHRETIPALKCYNLPYGKVPSVGVQRIRWAGTWQGTQMPTTQM